MDVPRTPPSTPLLPRHPLAVGAIGASQYWFWHYVRLLKLFDGGWAQAAQNSAWAIASTPTAACNVVPGLSNPWNLDPLWYVSGSVKKAFQEWSFDWQTKLWTLCAEYKSGW
jgi:hypothetical protein